MIEDLSLQRWSGVDVDINAIESNMRHLVERCAPSSVWAVVKANGYGHGAITVSRAAVAGGAGGAIAFAVAVVLSKRFSLYFSGSYVLCDNIHLAMSHLLSNTKNDPKNCSF